MNTSVGSFCRSHRAVTSFCSTSLVPLEKLVSSCGFERYPSNQYFRHTEIQSHDVQLSRISRKRFGSCLKELRNSVLLIIQVKTSCFVFLRFLCLLLLCRKFNVIFLNFYNICQMFLFSLVWSNLWKRHKNLITVFNKKHASRELLS